MISPAIIVLAAGACVAGYYGLAFWVLALAIANGAVATVWAIINPDWHWNKRMGSTHNPRGDSECRV